MSQHTPEPWSYCEDNDGWSLENGVEQHGYSLNEANARRIVSCVNFCVGMDTDDIEGTLALGSNALLYSRNKEAKIKELIAQRDELLAALKAFDTAAKESSSIIGFAGKALKLLADARAAIAKCEVKS